MKGNLTSRANDLHHEMSFNNFVRLQQLFRFLMIKQFLKSKILMIKIYLFIFNFFSLTIKIELLTFTKEISFPQEGTTTTNL